MKKYKCRELLSPRKGALTHTIYLVSLDVFLTAAFCLSFKQLNTDGVAQMCMP
jgi:hypothetical protein